jgi:transposase
MKAIHGGKAKNNRIDSLKIATLMRGGSFPMAYVYPAEMRATRDLLRRRNYLTRKRADLLSHIQTLTAATACYLGQSLLINQQPERRPLFDFRHRSSRIRRYFRQQLEHLFALRVGRKKAVTRNEAVLLV